MLISTDVGTYVLSMTTLKVLKVSNSSQSWGLSYDFKNSKIYWAGGDKGSTIFRSDSKSFASEAVVTVSGVSN